MKATGVRLGASAQCRGPKGPRMKGRCGQFMLEVRSSPEVARRRGSSSRSAARVGRGVRLVLEVALHRVVVGGVLLEVHHGARVDRHLRRVAVAELVVRLRVAAERHHTELLRGGAALGSELVSVHVTS